MEICLLKLKCITNLHVGNGDVNYNIIDNEVEKDPVTGYPTIHASGVKGALRQHFQKTAPKLTEKLFGSANRKDGNPGTGALKILSADLLARAMRASSGTEAYYLVTTEDALSLLKGKLSAFGYQLKTEKVGDVQEKAAEGYPLITQYKILGETVYTLKEDDFKGIALPCYARNHLNNGISDNLWYEEVVPHQSVFTLIVGADDEESLEPFPEQVNNKVIQFGGNATVGCGYCKITQQELEAAK